MRKKKFYKKHSIRVGSLTPLDSMLDAFILSRAKYPEQINLRELWKHWGMVLGDELAEIAKPLGTRGTILLIGSCNNLELQEAYMQYDDILDRCNAFMRAFGHAAFFEKIEFSLFQGKAELDKKIELPKHINNILPERPKKDTYTFIDFGDNHALALCYEAYCARLDKEKDLETKEQ